MTEDNPDQETTTGTFTTELDGIDATITGEVQLHETITPPDQQEPTWPDNRYEFTGEALQLRSTRRTPAMQYSFTIDDVTDGESLEDADSYEEQDDGRVYVEGTIGPKGSDTFFVEGKLSDWEAVDVDSGEVVEDTAYDVAVADEVVPLWDLLGYDAPENEDDDPKA